jgi:ribosomal protein L11 methyltransferase
MPDPSPSSASVVARLSTDRATAQAISDALTESFDAEQVAASALEGTDGRWSLAIHFREPPNEAAVRALVALAADAAAANALRFERLAATDWVRASLEGLAPVAAGRFVVHGAHDRTRVPANRIGIEIAAALAFGTGHHGTTRGCLLALDRIVKVRAGAHRRRGVRAQAILDVGTGTGVLAIAAARALRRAAVAGDIDVRAVKTARDNARLNRVGALVRVVHVAGVGARGVRERAPFGLVFANILLEPLKRLATPMARLVGPGGRLVLSGLLPAQAGAALAVYRLQGLALERRITLAGWATLVLLRPAAKPRPSRRPATADRQTAAGD